MLARFPSRPAGCSHRSAAACGLVLLLFVASASAAAIAVTPSLPVSSVLLTPHLHSLLAEDGTLGRPDVRSLGTFVPANLPTAPPCGLSPCDAPEAVASWKARVAQQQRYGGDEWPVVLRARVFVLSNDDGSSPLLQAEDIEEQFRVTNESLLAAGLAFTHSIVPLHNSSARARVVVPFCEPALIGDGSPCTGMKAMCNVSVTGWAGGDCLPQPLPPQPHCTTKSNDTVCNPECNFAAFGYDGGDCCLPAVAAQSCREPNHPLRAWLTQDLFRTLPALQGTPPDAQHFSIYPVAYPPPEECAFCGASTTMPWDFNMSDLAAQGSLYAFSSFQGVNSATAGGSIPVHEMGHTFGLLHPFRGLEPLVLFPQIPVCGLATQDTCIDARQYNQSSADPTRGLLSGDLVDDTPVSPMFLPADGACGQQPSGSDCGGVAWSGVPTRNFMGFNYFTCSASDLEFTQTQIAKMHCTLDWRYREWVAPAGPLPSGGGSKDLTARHVAIALGISVAILGLLCVFYAMYRRRRQESSFDLDRARSSSYQLHYAAAPSQGAQF